MVRKPRIFAALAALLALAIPAHAWHCRVVVVGPAAVTYGAAPAAAPGYTATYAATYSAAPASTYAVSPAVAAPTVGYASWAAYAVAPVAVASAPAPAPAAVGAAPCAASVTDREIEARLSRVGAALGTGGRLTAVQPMSNAQLTERLAQLAATVEALAQVVEVHGKKLGGK